MAGKYDHLDRNTLIRLLEQRDANRQLGLVWEREELEADNALNDDYVALSLDPDLSHGDGPWPNLIIEGDNYDALRALRATHKGKIRCIYIDPPYNTGNRDFVYNDRFIEKTHTYRHSLWLEFMHKRLVLAKELLANDGLIFVSIDDNEVFRIGMLMDRIFGEENLIQTMIWKKSYGGGSKSRYVVGLHEYVLCYAKRKDDISHIELPSDPESRRYYTGMDEKYETRGPFRTQPLATNSMDARPNLRFPIIWQENEIWPDKQWQWSRDRVAKALANNELLFSNSRGRWSVRYKQYLRDENGIERGSKPTSIMDGPYTQDGTAEIRDIFGDGKYFSFPKPSDLIAHLLRFIHWDKSADVLDFFAGSGTTAHAVAKLNAEDGGNRRFILVSSAESTEDQPNKNLCRDVCAERVRRVMTGYTNARNEQVAGLGGSFAYLRSRRVPKHRLSQKLAHGEIWNALELTHGLDVSPWSGTGLATRNAGDNTLAYLADFKTSSVDALTAFAATHNQTTTTLYSWAPDRVRDLLPCAQHQPIPQFLRDRFGNGTP